MSDDLLDIIAREMSATSEADQEGLTTGEESLSYYLGRPNGREVDGRSSVTSTDVADAIEWIMPQVMNSLTKTNQVVSFDPTHDGDEHQAELESEYVHDVIMKQNDGFIEIHEFVKDALMQRNGILKIYYEEVKDAKIKDYTGLTEPQVMIALMDDKVELLESSTNGYTQDEQTGQEVETYNIKVSVDCTYGRIVVESIPREQFRINSDHNSVNPENARFTAHVTTMTESELRELGVTDAVIAELPDSSTYDQSAYRHEQQQEDSAAGSDIRKDTEREIDVAECYVRYDDDGDGVSELMKVLVAGHNTPTEILMEERIECSPWVAATPILMSHKFEGLSITDRLKEIQEQKTTLWRNMFDNLYLQNNQRHVVVENQVNLDDLLVSRPGGLIRAKSINAIMPLETPQMSGDAYNMMKYLDEVRAGRSGVSADGPSAPQNLGDNVGSDGLERLMSAKEELVGLIVRVIAETGFKYACVKVRNLLMHHFDAILDYKFRGEWVKLTPKQWITRSRCTVRVGTGTGDTSRQMGAILQVIGFQEKILMNPNQAMVKEDHVFAAMDDFCRFAGLHSAAKYFIDPKTQTGAELRKQKDQSASAQAEKAEKMQQAQLDMQIKIAEAELAKVQVQRENNQLKAQLEGNKLNIELQEKMHKAQLESAKQRLSEFDQYIKEADLSQEVQYKYDKLMSDVALELTRMEQEESVDNLEQEYQGNLNANQ